MNHLPWSYHDYGGRKQVPTLSVQPCFVPCMHGRLARPPDVSAPSLRQNWPHSEAMLVWASGGKAVNPKNPRWSFSKQKRLWKTQKIHKNSRFPWCLVFQTSRNLVNPVNPSLESTWLPSFPLRELLELWLVPSDKIRRVGTLGLMRARPKLVGGMGEMRRRSVGILPFIGRETETFEARTSKIIQNV